jgi:hypothetical protein
MFLCREICVGYGECEPKFRVPPLGGLRGKLTKDA